MPFALVTIGLIMIVSGARDTYAALGKELTEDFTGPGNFLYWLIAIGFLGALGSVKELQGFSRAFMALVLISMVIANRGFGAELTKAVEQGPVRPGDNAKMVGGSSTDDNRFYDAGDWQNIVNRFTAQADAETQQNFNRFADIVKLFL